MHIDHNVCFDKGIALRVPELVPFRLTRVLRDAMGPGGMEGPFKGTLHALLRTLRAHREVSTASWREVDVLASTCVCMGMYM